MNYVSAETLEAALQSLEKPGVKIIAGGTDLCVQMEEHLLEPEFLVDITACKELRNIQIRDDFIHIGAAVTIADIGDSLQLPACLREGARAIGSPQIRNLATIGGNICNASPCGDTLPPLLVLHAVFSLISIRGERKISAADFFTGPKSTVIEKGEILREIIIPAGNGTDFSAFKMTGKRKGQVISQVNSAVWLSLADNNSRGNIKEARIAIGSVAPVPLRLRKAEALITGKRKEDFLGEDGIRKEIADLVMEEISPIDDVRATKDYRNAVAAALVYDVLIQAFGGKGE